MTVDPKYSGQFSTFYNTSSACPAGRRTLGREHFEHDRRRCDRQPRRTDDSPRCRWLSLAGQCAADRADRQSNHRHRRAPIHFSNLANSYSTDFLSSYIPSGQFPGLDLQLPGYGLVSATVQNTPSNVITEIDTGTTAIGGLTVLGTTGPLFLANPNYGRYYGGTRPLFTFSASSVTIGAGTTASIVGPISLGQDYHVTGDTTIDDGADATPRQVSFSTSTQTLTPYTIDGLSPGSILVSPSIQSPHLAVYGPPAANTK